MLSPIDVRFLDDGRNVMVLAPFTYEQWTIPVGFVSDGASISRILWTLVGDPYTGHYRRAAILHDYLYKSQTIGKKKADNILLEAMLADGTSSTKAWVIFVGVRVFGVHSWIEDGDER